MCEQNILLKLILIININISYMKMLIFQKNELIEGYGKILRKYKEKYYLIGMQLYKIIDLLKLLINLKEIVQF